MEFEIDNEIETKFGVFCVFLMMEDLESSEKRIMRLGFGAFELIENYISKASC